MPGRTPLSSMKRSKGGTAPPEVTSAAAEKSGGKKEEHAMTLRMPKRMNKALKMKAIDEDSNVTAIILRAIEREMGQSF